ncbi:hypothetical protein EHS13_29170 [Paenibacillus psychroresistens]|uniref:RNA polymerase sigma-70 region 2 domain-containing protein n=1 Tax=Paenibacillus psychroresistens TaxID=1778678 RepID=A0A6B8RSW5_9BACL|nr:hypothetical protein EHS13_29170 [Paenibacillus psychroresistens]
MTRSTHYCKAMTGSPWDAEDLVQETLLKTYAVLPKLWQPLNYPVHFNGYTHD